MSFTAKSVIFDIADGWGDGTFVGLRAVDFYNEGVKLPLTDVNFTAYHTSTYNDVSRHAKLVFDTSLSKTGGGSGTSWLSLGGQNTNQRLIVVFNTPQTFDEIRVNNAHATNTVGGTETDRGAKNVKIQITDETITDTTYDAAVSGGSEIFNSTFVEHVASDVEDEQTLILKPLPSDAFRVKVLANSVPASETDFELGIRLSILPTRFWDTVTNTGGDIRCYSDADLTTEIPREVAHFDKVGKDGTLYVKVPLLSESVDTYVYITVNGVSLDYAFTDPYGRNAVWSNYEAVLQLNEDPSGSAPQFVDSTGNANDGTAGGGMTTANLVAGDFGKAIAFDGVDDKIVCGSLLNLITSNLNVDVAAKFNNVNGNQMLVERRSTVGTSPAPFLIYNRSTGTVAYNEDNVGLHETAEILSANEWAYISVNRSLTAVRIFKNGNLELNSPFTSTNIDTTAVPLTLGLDPQSAGLPLDGTIQQVKITTADISDNRRSLSALNYSDPNFVEYEPPLKSVKVTINSVKVEGSIDFTNFVFRLDLNQMSFEFWETVKPTGEDIRAYTDEARTTQVPVEVCADFSKPDKKGSLYVLIPTLSVSVDTELWVTADGQSDAILPTDPYGSRAVWADYVLAIHMDDQDATGDTLLDSAQGLVISKDTANNPLEVAGLLPAPTFGKAQEYLDASDAASVNHTSLDGNEAELYISTILKPYFNSGVTEYYYIFSKALSIDVPYRLHYHSDVGSWRLRFKTVNDGQVNLNAIGLSFSANEVHKLEVTYDGASAKMFWDGEFVSSVVATGLIDNLSGTPTYIGRDEVLYPFLGVIDKVLFSFTAPTSERIKTTHNNEFDPVNFYSVNNRKVIEVLSINPDKVPSDVVDYDLYVDMSHLSDTFWAAVREGGGDIRVYTDPFLAEECPREVKNAVKTTKTGSLFIKVPSVSSSVETNIYIVADGLSEDYAATDPYGRNAVWTNYLAVYHLDEDPADPSPQLIDSTGNGHDGSCLGGMDTTNSVPGQIGNAIEFDGVSEYALLTTLGNLGSNMLANGSSVTVYSAQTIANSLLTTYNAGDNTAFQFGIGTDPTGAAATGRVRFLVRGEGSRTRQAWADVDTGAQDGLMHKIDYQFIPGTQDMEIYVDGVKQTLAWYVEQTLTSVVNFANPFALGAFNNRGTIGGFKPQTNDEVRVSSKTYSQDWLSTQFNNMDSPSTFYTVGVTGEVSGIVTENGTPVARVVRAYNRETGALIAQTTSDGVTGEYTLSVGTVSSVYVIALDDDAGLSYNAVIFDKITP